MEYLLVDREKWIVVDPRTILISTSKEGWERIDKKAKSTI